MTTTNNKIAFIAGSKISIKQIPKYPHFCGNFIENVDYTLAKMITETIDRINETSLTGFKNKVFDNLNNNGELVVNHNQ